jgi:hypothetical protein
MVWVVELLLHRASRYKRFKNRARHWFQRLGFVSAVTASVAAPCRVSGRARCARGRPGRLGLAAAGCYRAGPLPRCPPSVSRGDTVAATVN